MYFTPRRAQKCPPRISVNNSVYTPHKPVIEWSSRDGGVWAGVWWCDDASPNVDADKPPYNALKSSGVLLHFRLFWCCSDEFLLFSKLFIEAAARRSWDSPRRRFSCDAVIPIRRFSWKLVINFESWWPLCCILPCVNAWSSNRPCCRPSSPPTKFGRKSSMSLACVAFAAEKFSCRLNMAGNILNWAAAAAASFVGLNEFEQYCCWPEVDVGMLVNGFGPVPQLPPATQLVFLKSNLPSQ